MSSRSDAYRKSFLGSTGYQSKRGSTIMEQQEESKKESKRPVAITIACIIGFFGAPVVVLGLLIPSIREPLVQQYGASFVPTTALVSMMGLAALIGYWRM